MQDTPTITRAAIAMAGGPDEWSRLSPDIQRLYLEMAERAASVLLEGKQARGDGHEAP